VNIALPDAVTAQLGRLQERFDGIEGLLRVPEHALHISVLNLIDVRTPYRQGKAELWERFGSWWISAAAKAVEAVEPFMVTYREVRATGAAVIAVAQSVAVIDDLRRAAAERLSLPRETPSQRQLLHTTLFRYASRDVDMPRIREVATTTPLDVSFVVEELAVNREDRFPSLELDTLAILPLERGIDEATLHGQVKIRRDV